MRITFDLNCGEETCAKEPGVFCQYVRSRTDGFDPRCNLFDKPLFDSDGGILGWLLRCKECKKAAGEEIIPENTEKTELSTNLNVLRDEAFACAEKQGFHGKPVNFGERLMLVVSELSEALEADRGGKRSPTELFFPGSNEARPVADVEMTKEIYERHIRGTVEEELADAIIRLCAIAGIYNIDLDWHIAAKMACNRTRPYKHGKAYG